MLIANRDQQGKPAKLEDQDIDENGEATVGSLQKSFRLASWITGNTNGSLGLHPAVYFYGPTGVHSGPMFMGTVALIGRKLANNDKEFFKTFTSVRARLEAELVRHKDLIATILQRLPSVRRNRAYEAMLGGLVDVFARGDSPTEAAIVEMSGLKGKTSTLLSTRPTATSRRLCLPSRPASRSHHC